MSFFRRLYRGETRADFIGARKNWYLASAVILLICIASMVFRQFNFGIEFAGGNQFVAPAKSGTTLEQVRDAVEDTGVELSSAQERGQGEQRKYVIRTPELREDSQRLDIMKAISSAGDIAQREVSVTQVSSSWGKSVTQQALLGLGLFLLLVSAYLWIRYEHKMAMAAIFALFHDLLLTAGVYSIVGFEVTPGTVIGLLTILGYSLYDTVVVFDKVDENTRGILGHMRFTYPEAANSAVNQTLMRSINTSLVALLPVGGLLFIGAGVLGVGTLKDLALVLFVGMMTGAYSSLFLATPWLVDLKMTDQRYKSHAQRVLTRRSAIERGEEPTRRVPRAARAARATSAAAPGASNGAATTALMTDETGDSDEPAETGASRPRTPGPRPGNRPAARKRQGGKRR
jgi:preprotein translocase subunit SecF